MAILISGYRLLPAFPGTAGVEWVFTHRYGWVEERNPVSGAPSRWVFASSNPAYKVKSPPISSLQKEASERDRH